MLINFLVISAGVLERWILANYNYVYRILRLYSDFPTDEYAKYQAGYVFYPDFKCAEFCQFLYNISVCKGFIMKPAEKSTCAPTSSMVAHSRAG
jgi:hypothetical protein